MKSRRKRGRLCCIVLSGLLLLGLMGCGSAESVFFTNTTEESGAPVYALVTKSEGNRYNELLAEGFCEVIEEAGGTCIVYDPAEATAEEQIKLIESLILQKVDAIAVSANDADALSSVLQDAMNEGIKVSTVDSDVGEEDRLVFVNQVSTQTIAETLVEAVYELCDGEGQWAILSTTSHATNQTAWITAMRKVLEEEKYQNLRLVDIVYGNDEEESSAEKTRELLEQYPDLKVICAPTTVGLEAAAKVLSEEESSVKVTGLGLPSAMAEYVTGKDPICPCLFLWNPIELGRMSAYVSLALVSGELTGSVGESFTTKAGELFTVEENSAGAAEVIVAPPLQFDASNIKEWQDQF